MSTNTNTTEIIIKPTISFTEYKSVCDKVVNSCFPDGIYSPEYRDLIEKYSIILAYVPNYDLGIEEINSETVDELYVKLYSPEVIGLYDAISANAISNMQCNKLIIAIDEAIEFKKNLIYKTSAYSETDMALSSLVFKLEEIVGKLGENITEENISKAMKFLTTFGENKDNFATGKIIDTLINKKIIGKEYKETKKSSKTISKTK